MIICFLKIIQLFQRNVLLKLCKKNSWGCSSAAQCLPGRLKALSSISGAKINPKVEMFLVRCTFWFILTFSLYMHSHTQLLDYIRCTLIFIKFSNLWSVFALMYMMYIYLARWLFRLFSPIFNTEKEII